MKKTLIKLLCLTCSVILILTSCTAFNAKKEPDFNIEDEEYIIRFNLVGGYAGNRYTFILTPDHKLLAEYKAGNNIQQAQIQLSETQIDSMEERIDEVLTLTEDDIEFFVGIADYWYCTICYNDVKASFDYGASKSTTVNILLEQIIGCIDSEEALKTKENLKPIPSLFRENMSYYRISEED